MAGEARESTVAVRPLQGKRVLVTRARAQAEPLSAVLRAAGAVPVEFPAIRIEPAADYTALDDALRAVQRYDWAIFTSVNAIAHVERRLESLGLSWQALQQTAVAAIGPKTAHELRTRGVAVSYMPAEYVSTAIATGLPLAAGQRVLLARADIADKRLVEGLRARGARVDEFVAYRTTLPRGGAGDLRARLAAHALDAVTFASSSTVRNLCAALGDDAAALLAPIVVACIGPVTAETARACGLEPRVVARAYTIEGLVAALEAFFAAR
jgi:uroporphyrinogen III methyltransferase / synthase